MDGQTINISEILLANFDEMVCKLATGIGEAQKKLDLSALQSQANLQRDFKDLADIGYKVPWYVIPEANFEVKVAIHFEEKIQKDGSKILGWFFSPFNAKYKNAYSFEGEGASTFKMRIVPLPPS